MPLTFAVAALALSPQSSLNFQPFDAELFGGAPAAASIAFLQVPENRSRPTTRNIKLAVVRLKSRSEHPGAPVIFLSGGPGQAAIPMSNLKVWTKLLESHDVLLLDQRGVGRSTPSATWVKPESLPHDSFLTEDAMLGWLKGRHRQAFQALTQEGFDLSGYNVQESADDVDDLRKALGLAKVDLLGFSYGTHLALSVIRRHGPSIESAVLIGTEGPDDALKLPSVLNLQLQKLSSLAAEDSNVRSDVPDLMALLEQDFKMLDQHPLVVEITDRIGKQKVILPVGRFGLQLVIRLDMGDRNDFTKFPALVYSISQRDPKLLARFVEKRYNSFGLGISGMATMMDLFSGASPERRARLASEMSSSILGKGINLFTDELAGIWGNPDLGPTFRSPFFSSARTMFVSGSLDSNTPPFQAEAVRWGFPNSCHLVVEYAGHEDALEQDAVIAQIDRFLNGEEVTDRWISMGKPQFLAVR